MTLARRRVLKFAMASTALATLSACGAGGMGGMATGMMGGGGGKSWSDIISSFENLMNQAEAGVADTHESLAMLADALGLKQEAAVLRGEAKNIRDKGTAFAASDLDESINATNDGLGRINDKLAQAKSLNAGEKQKIGEAMANYAPAALKVGLSAIDAGIALSDISSAGTPTPADGMKAISVAKDAPSKAPAIIKFAKLSVQGFKDLRAIAKENDIAVPATDELDALSI